MAKALDIWADDHSRQINIPTGAMCRDASRYLNSIINLLPQGTQEFIRKYPYTSALIFTLGADSITWTKSSERGGFFLLMETRNFRQRDKGFPIYEIVASRIYIKEVSILAELGFNYEVNYLKKNGADVSEYEYVSLDEVIQHNNILYPDNTHVSYHKPDTDFLSTMYYFTREDVEMLKDGNGHVPELLFEKLQILKDILDELEICADNGKLLTEHIADFDHLPGKINLVYPAVNCMSQEAIDY